MQGVGALFVNRLVNILCMSCSCAIISAHQLYLYSTALCADCDYK